jgi:flagellar biosynthetic protein FlhB
MADDLGERTEDATPRRKQEAREEGQVARSMDLTSALLLLGAVLTLWIAGLPALGAFKRMLEGALDGDTIASPITVDSVGMMFGYLSMPVITVVLPMLLVIWALAYVSVFWQVGWLFAPKAAKPKLSKLSPIAGFKRIFGTNALVKAGLDTFKVALVLLVAIITIGQYERTILVLAQLAMLEAVSEIGKLLLDLSIRVLAVLLFLGVLDYCYQKYKHARDLRMSKQQVKDEMKQMDGDPDVKRRRMRMQQQLAMQRISSAVPKADVIVTNPEHFSIAISYDQASMNAPKVVAKGADFIAMRIRQIALTHGIPIVERPPLARALYKQVRVGDEIPPDFYKAVAEILAYVYRLSESRQTA